MTELRRTWSSVSVNRRWRRELSGVDGSKADCYPVAVLSQKGSGINIRFIAEDKLVAGRPDAKGYNECVSAAKFQTPFNPSNRELLVLLI